MSGSDERNVLGSVLLDKSLHAPELLGIGNFAGHLPNTESLIDAWVDNIANRLGAKFARGEVTRKERQAAENHIRKRYGTLEWQKRR